MTSFNVDTDFIDPSIYHTFGSPCFILDSRLQSGVRPIHAGPTAQSETTETSPDGDLLQCPLLPFVSTSFNGETVPSQEEDSFPAPRLINLETTGLW